MSIPVYDAYVRPPFGTRRRFPLNFVITVLVALIFVVIVL